MKKQPYRIVKLVELKVEELARRIEGQRVVVSLDVAKVDMVAAIVAESKEVLATVGWKAPLENGTFVALLAQLRARSPQVEVVMEPSGTYADALRYRLLAEGYQVFAVSGKRTHDAAELYDGVPSLHDGKSAMVIARLHLEGLSRAWPADSAHRRKLQAALATMEMFQDQHQRLVNQLESWLARYWPELTVEMELTNASLAALLGRIGGPERVAADPEAAMKLLHGMSRGLLSKEKARRVVEGAAMSCGVPMLEEENTALRELGEETLRTGRRLKGARRVVEELGEQGVGETIARVVGKATSAVLLHDVGDPTTFGSSRAYLKAMGLNLKERSSGTKKGRLAVTKRGPSRARKYLWLAACRLLQKDVVTRAWYQKKVGRDGGKRSLAVVAVMRKLAKALFHVARGSTFESTKLFDTTRLELVS